MKKRRKINFSPAGKRAALAAAAIIGLLIGFWLWLPQSKPKQTPQVYFFKAEKLYPVSRPIKSANEAIKYLLFGPTKQEAGAGLWTLVPSGLKIKSVQQAGKTLIIDFDQRLANYSGSAAMIRGLLLQIVFTATDYPGVDQVRILIGGKGEVVLGGEGLVIEKPLTRQDLLR